MKTFWQMFDISSEQELGGFKFFLPLSLKTFEDIMARRRSASYGFCLATLLAAGGLGKV